MGDIKGYLKLKIVFILIIFCSFTSQAQFLNKDAVWNVEVSTWGDGYRSYIYGIKINKDSVINDTLYSIFKYGEFLFALREDSNKVYHKTINEFIPPESYDSIQHILYDFNLVLNDTIQLFLPNNRDFNLQDWVVEKVDSIQIGYELKKRLKLQLIPGDYYEQYWIEDIGSTYGPLYFTGISEFERGFELHCYSINGEKLYGKCEVSGVNPIQKEIKDLILFDPGECRIKVTLPSTNLCNLKIYFLTGIKIKQLEIPCNQFVGCMTNFTTQQI